MNNASGKKNGAKPVPKVGASLWVIRSSATGDDNVLATSVRCCGVHDGTWVEPAFSFDANSSAPAASLGVPAANCAVPCANFVPPVLS